MPFTRNKRQPWRWHPAGLKPPFRDVARGAGTLFPLWETQGNARDLITGRTLGITAGTTWSPTPYGPAPTRTAGTTDHFITANWQPITTSNGLGTGDYSIAGVANPAEMVTTPNNAGALLIQRRTNPFIQTGLLFNFNQFGAEAANQVTAYTHDGTIGIGAVSATIALSTDTWRFFGMTRRGTIITLAVDEALFTVDTQVRNILDTGQDLMVGGLAASGYGTTGSIMWAGSWNRALSTDELRTLSRDWTGLFEADRPTLGWRASLADVPSAPVDTPVAPAAAAPILSGFTPLARATDHKTPQPAATAVVLSAASALARVTDHKKPATNVAQPVLSGFAPQAGISEHKAARTGAATGALFSVAPTVRAEDHQTAAPAPCDLAATGFAPQARTTGHATVLPAAALADLLSAPPTATLATVNRVRVSWVRVSVIDQGDLARSIGTAEPRLAGFAPQAQVSGHAWSRPEAGDLAGAGAAPTAHVTEHKTAQPGPADLGLAANAPVLVAPVTVATGAAAGALSSVAATVARTGIAVTHPATALNAGGWEAVGAATLADAINDDAAEIDDDDHIQSPPSPNRAVARLQLGPLGQASAPEAHVVRYRYAAENADPIELTVRLIDIDTETEVAAWTHAGVGTAWITTAHTLTGLEVARITNYANLALDFEAHTP